MGLDGMEWQRLERRARSGFGRADSAAIGVSASERRCVNTDLYLYLYFYGVLVQDSRSSGNAWCGGRAACEAEARQGKG